MTTKIGIRDLKSQASRLVQEVSEARAEFVITRRGEPVARLVPLEAGELAALEQAERDEVVAELETLARQIGESWQSERSARQLLEDVRGD